MSELAVLHREIDTLPQRRVGEAPDFVGNLQTEGSQHQDDAQEDMDEPNEETIAAIEEGRAMRRGETPVTWYNSLDEMWKALHK